MSTSAALEAREILSESNLHKAVMGRLGSCRALEPGTEGVTIGPGDVDQIVDAWRLGIERQVRQLTRFATSTLADLPAGCLYQRLDEKDWQTAAQVCEIFRNPDICKNAGRLDTQALQHSVHDCLAREEPFRLAIGWGQPKRGAGGLKTLGPWADLAEMYAIRRLLVIVRTTARLARKPVTLTVLTGGSRFFEALFTRPDIAAAYDVQRQAIADALAEPGAILFRPHSELIGGDRTDRFSATLATVSDEMIAPKFGTILLNIDWEHLFAPDPKRRYHVPHGIALPGRVQTWLEERDEAACRQLIRATIIGLTSPKHQSDWLTSFENDDVFEDALSFVQAVAWESARKYIALHLMDANDEASTLLGVQGANTLRLTVHEKRDRHDIPAIFSLGPSGGNLLSQHVMAGVLNAGAVVFESYAELQWRDVVAIRLRPEGNVADAFRLFGWLVSSGQPLCFVESTANDPVNLICDLGNSR